MSLHAKFSIKSEPYKGLDGREKTLEGVLFFEFKRKSRAFEGYDFELVTRATETHAKDYPQAWKDFKKENPDFVAAWEPKVEKVAEVKAEPDVSLVEHIETLVEQLEEEKPKRKSKKSKELEGEINGLE
jgi:hypothetical protein